MKMFRFMLLALSLGFSPALAKLSVGDKAPELKVGEWIQGEAVQEFSSDKVYVVEFWATWCGPCVATIPHLDEMHEALKDKGVVFIGQNCMEDNVDKVKKFVTDMGEKMSYRVATDAGNQMAKNWLEAAEQPGIPCAFVVGKDGKLAWIGHPQLLKAEMLTQVAAGTFDAKKAAEEIEKTMAAQQALMKKSQELNAATLAKDWDKALEIVDELEKEQPGMTGQLSVARLSIGLKKGDNALVLKSGTALLGSDEGDEQQLLNQIAWQVATEMAEPSGEVLEMAEKAARRAVEKSNSADGAVLDTLARVLFMAGKKDEAILIQEKAVAAADEALVDDLKKTLECYKAGKLRNIHD